MNTWFTSDQHYWHTNILHHSHRPFESVTLMNEELIKRHNERVAKTDTVYYLGDVCLGAPSEILNRLNGRKHLIQGNHDERWISKYHSGNWFQSINQVKLVKIDEQQIWLSHYPHESWPSSHYGTWNLHGHSHGGSRKVRNRCDVGVDCWDLYPVSFEQLQTHFATVDQEVQDGHQAR